ncbi:MAG: AbrB/MazE/SpoVT family DNA-binding domain-containing protein [Opitutales bacterium]
METVSLTSKHQITIPSKVRRSLNLHKGDRLSFDLAADGSCVVRKLAIRKSDGAAKAYLGQRSVPLSDAMMREAIQKGALESYRSRKG